MKKFILILVIPFVFSFQEIAAQNAPIITIGNVDAYGTTAIVPITVTGFTEIGACSLLINYDPAVATATSVLLGPGIGYYTFFSNIFTPGEISVSWVFFLPGVQGLTLPDNSVFLNITLDRTAYGYSNLEFDLNHPLYCEFYDWESAELNDTPNSTYYIDGSVTFASGSTQWTGNIDDDWSDDLNWTSNVPGATSIAIINDVSPNLFPSANTNAECLGLEIASGASVTVPESNTLTVYGNLGNNGQLTIESSSAGDGSFINYGPISGTGSASVGRYLTSERWHYISSPIADGVAGVFLNLYLINWDEQTGEWSFIVPVNTALNPMQGFAVWADDDLTGTTTVYYQSAITNLNSGSFVSGPLTCEGPNDPETGSRGYNLVGNPYPSAIDWDITAGWNKSWLDNAIYIWNPDIGNYGSYVGGISNNDVTNIIPGGIGFFVHNSNDGFTTTLTVNNKARVHDSKSFFKNSENELQTIRLSITSEMNTFSDEVITSFNENASADFDPSYDALNLKGDGEAPDIFAKSADNKNLSINTYPALVENVVIPIGCKIGANGYYTITATDIANFSETTQILLKDKIENVYIDLTKQNSYTFIANLMDPVERFDLHILPNPSNTIEIENDLNIQIFAANKTIYLQRQDSKAVVGSLKVFDVLGRLILANPINGGNQYELPFDEHGVFIVTYFDKDEQTVYRQKVFLD